jgi:FKBP-type peptidyl-prolyl cis-trans isomerase
MKKSILSVVALGILMASCGDKKDAVSDVKMTNENDSLSYAIGLNLGESFSQGDLKELNYDLLVQGMKDQMDSTGAMELADAEKYIQEVMMGREEKKSEADKKAGEEFLAANKSKEGVQTTASGLQYKVMNEGTGAKPTSADDMVTVHYHGTLPDGTVFDSSVDRGEPATFRLNQVIPGWTEGLQLMSEGSKYQFFIPQELGYGARGMGKIKPYSALVFEVELIKVGAPAEAPGATAPAH